MGSKEGSHVAIWGKGNPRRGRIGTKALRQECSWSIQGAARKERVGEEVRERGHDLGFYLGRQGPWEGSELRRSMSGLVF